MTSYVKIVLLLALGQLACQHHVVFEEIGEMAGALSYIHAVVPVNISGLSQAVDNFKTDVRSLETLYKKTANIRSLRETLPAANADSTHLPHEDSEYRIRRRSPFTIIGGVIGHFYGLVYPAPA